MHSISISMLWAPLARVLATTALACVAGITTLGAGPAAHAARPTAPTGTLALGQGICIPCLRFKAASPPELLTTHYDWDGYREVDVFGRNFTPNRWMQFVITDRVTGEQVATALGWSGGSGYLTSFPGSGIPAENGAAIFNLPLNNCGGYGSDGLNIQAYDAASQLWGNVLYYNAACL